MDEKKKLDKLFGLDHLTWTHETTDPIKAIQNVLDELKLYKHKHKEKPTTIKMENEK